MIEIEKPKIEIVEISEDNRYGKFVCEPLERGYGTTLGNSLRLYFVVFFRGCGYNIYQKLMVFFMNFLLFLGFVMM